MLTLPPSVRIWLATEPGTPPKRKGLRVRATFDGRKVGVSVNGIADEDLAKIQMGDLINETM